MCCTPIVLKNSEMIVPCGHCIECLISMRTQWIFRIKSEAKHAFSSRFVTLTYNDENLKWSKDGEMSLCKKDLKLYFKRLYTRQKDERFFACGEYGSQGARPHYHAIILNSSDENIIKSWSVNGKEKGIVDLDEVNDNTIAYCTKYMINEDNQYDLRQRPFRLMSKGLGKDYLNLSMQKYYSLRAKPTVINDGGVETIMPRYYRNKIFGTGVYGAIYEKMDVKEYNVRMNEMKQKTIKASQQSKSNKV